MQATSVHSAQPTAYTPQNEADFSSLPDDPFGQLLYTLQQLSERSSEVAEARIDSTRKELRESLEELLENARKIAKKIREARDDGGFFSGLVDSVAKFVGKVVGTCVDTALPVDSVVALVEGLSTGQNVISALEAAAHEAVHTGDTAAAVGGFTEGVVAFSADLGAFQAKLSAALARAALTGEDPYALVEADAKQLFESFRTNILENDDFWQVVGAAAKGTAAAAAVASGGAAAIAAVVIVAALEVDRETGFIERAVGPEAAPYVRAGLALSAAACTGVALLGGSSGSARLLEIASSALSATVSIRSGYQTIAEANRQADALDASAENLQALNLIQQLERLLQRLVEALAEEREGQTTTRELGGAVMQTRVATDRALIVPA